MFSLRFLAVGYISLSILTTTGLAAIQAFDLSAFRGLYGAAGLAGCVQPCKDYVGFSLSECLDLDGFPGQCNLDFCVINNLWYVDCESPAVNPEGGACQTHMQPNEWRRWIVMRENECDDFGPSINMLDTCQAAPEVEFGTPCITDDCFGQFVIDGPQDNERLRCGP